MDDDFFASSTSNDFQSSEVEDEVVEAGVGEDPDGDYTNWTVLTHNSVSQLGNRLVEGLSRK